MCALRTTHAEHKAIDGAMRPSWARIDAILYRMDPPGVQMT
jgi:hypothetical protein